MTYIRSIKLTHEDITEFVTTALTFEQDVHLAQENVMASGKSLMGILCLDFDKRINLIVHDIAEHDEKLKAFSKWLIDEDWNK